MKIESLSKVEEAVKLNLNFIFCNVCFFCFEYTHVLVEKCVCGPSCDLWLVFRLVLPLGRVTTLVLASIVVSESLELYYEVQIVSMI